MQYKTTEREQQTYCTLALTTWAALDFIMLLSSSRRAASILLAVRSSQANILIIRMTVTATRWRQGVAQVEGLRSLLSEIS